MKKCGAVFLTAIILMLTNPGAFSQKWEIGVGGGVSYYVGDLNPTGHFKFPGPSVTIFGKRILTNRWALRAGIQYFRIEANDEAGDFAYQQVRNLNFSSNVFEVHVAAELNFFPFGINQRSYKEKIKTWTPYFVMGIGAYYYQPETFANGVQITDISGMGTEGQGTTAYPERKPYSKVMPCVPFGLGVKFNIKDKFTIAAEYSMRVTFNDYLDDVSSDYGINNQILAEHGQLAADISDQSKGDYAANSNDFYQRGIKTDWDWYGYLGVSLIFYIRDPSTCNMGAHR